MNFLCNVGWYPEAWKDRTVLYIEPHYDDFWLNAYSIYQGLFMRSTENLPKDVVVLSVSHSNYNKENGLRTILAKRPSTKIRIVELGLDDIENTKEFIAEYGKDVSINSLVKLYKPYPNLGVALGSMVRIYRPIVLVPEEGTTSHPFHKLITHWALEYTDHGSLWLYADLSYRNRVGGNEEPPMYQYNLTPEMLAKKTVRFVDHYSHMYSMQQEGVPDVGYDHQANNQPWMLSHYMEGFTPALIPK